MCSSAVQAGSWSSTADIRLEGHTCISVPALRHVELKRRIMHSNTAQEAKGSSLGRRSSPFVEKSPRLRMPNVENSRVLWEPPQLVLGESKGANQRAKTIIRAAYASGLGGAARGM